MGEEVFLGCKEEGGEVEGERPRAKLNAVRQSERVALLAGEEDATCGGEVR